MGVLTDYFTKLNKNIDYIDSKNYLKEVGNLLTKIPAGGKCLVIGAGNLSDIPVELLVNHFEEVVLSDIDVSAVQRNAPKEVAVVECELTGLEQAGLFNGLLNMLNTTKDYKEIKKFLDTFLDKDYNDQVYSNFNEKYDFIFISPIYTQLIYNQVLMVIDKAREVGYPEEILKFVEGVVLEKMVVVIDRFNSLVKRLLLPKGKVLALSDIFEGNHHDEFFLEIIKNHDKQGVLKKLYKEYFMKYGYGLGDYGLYSLSCILKEESQKYLLWPLSKEKNYLVSAMILVNDESIGGEV